MTVSLGVQTPFSLDVDAPLLFSPVLLFTMSHSNSANKSKPKKNRPQEPSHTAQILENVEFLVELYQDQGQPPASSNPFDAGEIEKVVETAVSKALSGSIEKALEDCLKRFDERIAKFDDRINQVGDQLDKLDTNVQALNPRFDSLDEKVESTTPRNDNNDAETESQLSSQLDSIGSDLANVVSKLEDKFVSLERTFEDQCETVKQLCTKISTTDSPKSETFAEPVFEKKEAEPVVDDSSSHWQKQKEEMLAKYDENHQKSDQAAADAKAKKSATNKSSESTDHSLVTDHAEIEKLKQDLNSKLREAEVELSINRARLSQERAAFERDQAELDRRTEALESKLAAMKTDGDDGKGGNGILSRFKRHLGG